MVICLFKKLIVFIHFRAGRYKKISTSPALHHVRTINQGSGEGAILDTVSNRGLAWKKDNDYSSHSSEVIEARTAELKIDALTAKLKIVVRTNNILVGKTNRNDH